MQKGHVLVLDCGTQSMRSIIYDTKGNLLGITKVKYPNYHMTQEGFIEMPVDVFWDSACKAVEKFHEKYPEIIKDVAAITLTSQRATSVFVDKEGKPLVDAISWMDTRKLKESFNISKGTKDICKVMKVWDMVDSYNRSCPYHWLKVNRKDIFEKICKCIYLSTYINFKLTGEYKDSLTSAPGYMPFNLKKLDWAKPNEFISKIFQIEKDKLFELVQPGETIGSLSEEAGKALKLPVGIPVIAAGSDKACETVGVGCLDTTTASVSLGSMVTIETTSPKYFELYKLGTVYPAAIKNFFNPEIGITRGFWLVSWFVKEFAELEKRETEVNKNSIEEILNEKIAEIPPGSDGLFLQPYWNSDLRYPGATGTLMGLSDMHTRIHFYRALIEGLGYSIKDGIHSIEKNTKHRVEKIALSGGGAQSDIICQILTDIFDRPTYVVQSHETSGLGAAMLGYLNLQYYENLSEAVDGMIHTTKVYKPNKDAAKVYNDLYEEIYNLSYKRLKPVYGKIKKLTNL